MCFSSYNIISGNMNVCKSTMQYTTMHFSFFFISCNFILPCLLPFSFIHTPNCLVQPSHCIAWVGWLVLGARSSLWVFINHLLEMFTCLCCFSSAPRELCSELSLTMWWVRDGGPLGMLGGGMDGLGTFPVTCLYCWHWLVLYPDSSRIWVAVCAIHCTIHSLFIPIRFGCQQPFGNSNCAQHSQPDSLALLPSWHSTQYSMFVLTTCWLSSLMLGHIPSCSPLSTTFLPLQMPLTPLNVSGRSKWPHGLVSWHSDVFILTTHSSCPSLGYFLCSRSS